MPSPFVNAADSTPTQAEVILAALKAEHPEVRWEWYPSSVSFRGWCGTESYPIHGWFSVRRQLDGWRVELHAGTATYRASTSPIDLTVPADASRAAAVAIIAAVLEALTNWRANLAGVNAPLDMSCTPDAPEAA